MSEFYLELNQISKSYRSPDLKKLDIIKNATFGVRERQSVAITGESGSGKSTLLNLLAGLDVLDSGTLRVQDKNFWQLSDEVQSLIRNKEFGFIFQHHYLLPEFTALENVLIPAWINGNKNLEQRAKDLLKQVGMEQRMTHKPGALSGGEAQRVAIARSLINSPKVIFADEPTGNLDQQNAHKIISVILSLVNQYGSSLVLVTHDIQIASLMMKRYQLKDGSLNEII